MLQHVSEFPSFLWLNKLPLYGYFTFYSSTHQLDIWVVPALGLLVITLLQTFRCVLWAYVFIILMSIPRSRSYGKFFKFGKFTFIFFLVTPYNLPI